MKIGVILLNFGEPEEATEDAVVPFLEKIFSLNAPLMGNPNATAEEVRQRSSSLARARAPGLIAEYLEIGGSPLHRQAREQAQALGSELARRGADATVFLGMQFTEPSIADAVAAARAADIDVLVSIGVYPLCGPSTNVAALVEVDRAIAQQNWAVRSLQVTGWHRHPAYLQVRADAIRELLDREGVDLSDAGTRLVFSAHGTPIRYLEDGSRYDLYVREFCAAVASELGAADYSIGYQNHSNRPGVQWTQPDIERVIAEVDVERVVVDPVSFMHEQSETLAELDGELREEAEARGLEFLRVPIPYLAPAFVGLLADLVQSATAIAEGEGPVSSPVRLFSCRCKPTPGTMCTNAGREPES